VNRTKNVTLATLLGVVIFLSKTVVPSPINKVLSIVQALLLALSALLLGRMGATYVSMISGILTAFWQPNNALFNFVFAVLYGLLTDSLLFVFKVRNSKGNANAIRLTVTMTISTALVALISYYVALFFGLFEPNVILELGIIIGTLGGSAAGYLASIIWNRYLKDFAV
jgi:tryptophan-rich sensory protein